MATSEQEGMPPAPESPRSMSSVPIDSSNRHPMLWFALVLAVAAALTVLVGFAVLQVKAVGNFRSWQRKPDAGNKLDSFSEACAPAREGSHVHHRGVRPPTGV
eukprot:gnl/TRDRNA2_/TRDRNA2_158059_c0_seq3.p2 gnl/TRDRNA2_/TRDRNA2_158059_c0~~gnl/TRDRNA2_/TRDRNA2_158059_c0_seq3.p2  ORF type:complete len:114 (+),score=19.72 gnl/TRDRNA2_/TRDRNA2_158059_c0_seq3:34-342(+)